MINKFNDLNKKKKQNFELQEEAKEVYENKTIIKIAEENLEDKNVKLLGKKIQNSTEKELSEKNSEESFLNKEKGSEENHKNSKGGLGFNFEKNTNEEENFNMMQFNNFMNEESISDDLSSSEESSINFK